MKRQIITISFFVLGLVTALAVQLGVDDVSSSTEENFLSSEDSIRKMEKELFFKNTFYPFVDSLKEALRHNDKQQLSTMFDYPIRMCYPLRSITNQEQFVQAYDLIVSAGMRDTILAADYEDWSEVGWRGIMLHNGCMWVEFIDQQFRIIGIDKSGSSSYYEAVQTAVERERVLTGNTDKNYTPAQCYITNDSTVLIHIWHGEWPKARLDFYYLGRGAEKDFMRSPKISMECTVEFEGSCANNMYTGTYDNFKISLWDADCSGYDANSKTAYGFYITDLTAGAKHQSFLNTLKQESELEFSGNYYYYCSTTNLLDWTNGK